MPLLNSGKEMDFDSDDSIKDPNFTLSDSTTTNSGADSDSNCEGMGMQLAEQLSDIRAVEIPLTKESTKVRKAKRNLGKTYITVTGKTVKAREVQLLNRCQKNCRDKISPELQETIFKDYWNMGNYNLRIAFIAGLIDIQDKKMTCNVKSSAAPRNRQYSYCYFLNINGLRTQVCQKCFKATLGETDRFLKTVISKKINSSGTSTTQDLRGKTPSGKKLPEERFKEIVDHIRSFPAYESHYSRSHSSKMYLNSDLSLSKMYKLYVELTTKPVSLSKYSQIFRTVGLKFKKPQLDTCTKCDIFILKIKAAQGNELANLLKQQKDHHETAERTYASKKNDIAAISPTSKVYTFDLQQCLPTPYLRSSVCYYKRQLYTFNLTVHDCGSGTH